MHLHRYGYFLIAAVASILNLTDNDIFAQSFQSLDFESGLHGWNIQDGAVLCWQIGTPNGSDSPSTAHRGNSCIGTVMNSTYSNNSNARLISPSFTVPPPGENPRLWFWHWFKIDSQNSDDSCLVEISTDGGTLWSLLTSNAHFGVDNDTLDMSLSQGWTQGLLDLSPFAGQAVKIAFHFISDGSGVDDGWYIDDIFLRTGVLTGLDNDFDDADAYKDWTIDNGTVWQIGAPVKAESDSPDFARSAPACLGTPNYDQYRNDAYARFISPPFLVDSGSPRMIYWQFYELKSNDSGMVQVSTDKGQSWSLLDNIVTNATQAIWLPDTCDLSSFAGDTIQVAFLFRSNVSGVGAGWFIDDISFQDITALSVRQVVGAPLPQSFELFQNYPNPFNPETKIEFYVPRASIIKVAIYNVLGQKVTGLVDLQLGPGRYIATWDGKDRFGTDLPSGVYFCKLSTTDFAKSIKMVLLR